ncbi:MAG: heme ABC transporter ATP-binding protein [Marinomonas sp.]
MSLEVKDLNLIIGAKKLLSDINFKLETNEVVAILGPNGAGKSTLFKVLSGEHRHYEGQVILEGIDLKSWKASDVAKLLGVLPQSSALAFPFSVSEVINLGRLPHSTGRVLDHQIITEAMSKADVSHLAGALYPSLSGGEKQRVQFARVLTQIWQKSDLGERYLLLDEPTSALDLPHQHQTLSLARDLAKEGVGVLAILHDLNLAAQYADRIILLSEGLCVAQGDVKTVLTPQQIENLYGIKVTVMSHPEHHYPLVIAS